MDRRLGMPRGEAPLLISFKSQEEKELKKGELSEAGGEDEGAGGTVGNIFKVAIWVGWEPSNCLSVFTNSPSHTRRTWLRG